MDFKSLISKIESIDGPIETPKAPELAAPIRLDEDTELRVLAGVTKLTESIIAEKAVSKSQQKFMGMVHAAHQGEPAASPEVAKAAKGMSKKDAEDFASTKHKGLPDKVSESDDRKPAKKSEREVELPSGAKVKATKVQGWQSQKADKDAEKDSKKDESIDKAAFKEKFTKMVEAKKAEKDDKKDDKKKSEKKSGMDLATLRSAAKNAKPVKDMTEGSKPDFLDVDKDGDKKEPMKKAAAEKGGDKKETKGLSDKQKKLPPGLQKAIAKKKGTAESTTKSKKVVAESVEQKLSLKEMLKVVKESGGQQAIDPMDKELWTWANRVASSKVLESQKAEIFAAMIYERNGGRFEMYDVLAEDLKTRIDESILNEGIIGRLKDIIMSKIVPKLSDEEKDQMTSAVQQALGKTDISISDFTPANIKAVSKAMGASPDSGKDKEESMSMEADDPFWTKSATLADKLVSLTGIIGGLASLIAAFTTGPAWLMIPGIIGIAFVSQVGTKRPGSGPVGSG